ncbi:MAG: U32 family peptidase, partial [Parcubacteria group bacterium]|nr:U32 family peptidase [Parcubacteria group bacterium]
MALLIFVGESGIIECMRYSKPEIMSPIKNWASLEACKNYADAVYFSVSSLNMRANSKAITLVSLNRFVKKCHNYNIKAYLAVNCTLYNNDLKKAEKIIKKAKQVGVDAVIVWDPAAIIMAKKEKIPFFISTQANISNLKTVDFYKKLGAKRVVLAREVSLKQIEEIKKKSKIEIETFVHGAMCVSESGRCILSAYLYGTSANCGACAQPCRKQYILEDEEGNKIVNQGKYFMSAKDLCMIEYIPELIKAGIDSFKIEGRQRDPRYIEITSRCYREAVDACLAGTYTKAKIKKWKQELTGVYNRGFSTGFYFSKPGPQGISYEKADNLSPVKKVLLGEVKHYFSKLGVAIVNFNHKGARINQEIIIEGNTTYLKQ